MYVTCNPFSPVPDGLSVVGRAVATRLQAGTPLHPRGEGQRSGGIYAMLDCGMPGGVGGPEEGGERQKMYSLQRDIVKKSDAASH